ncbi:MAG: hypothetical protein JXB14_02965 [Candidatus Altiarchaeota archaeon]|nr:hypothetical protein [Candidatus Altiarchaeota archaeon]
MMSWIKSRPREKKFQYRIHLEDRVKTIVSFQKGFETTCRISEVLERMSMIEDEAAKNNMAERLEFLTSNITSIFDSLTTESLELLAYFLPYDFKLEKGYIKKLAKSRPSKKLQAFDEGKNFFEILSKIHDSLRVGFLRSVLTLSGYPEVDLSLAVFRKIKF